MSITRRCPWCAEDHPLVPSKERPGRLIATCSLLGRAYYDCKATLDAAIAAIPDDIAAKVKAEIADEIAEHQALLREEEE